MIADEPQILTMRPAGARSSKSAPSLPFGLFTPLKHRTLEIGLRDWVKGQTGLDLGYVEQLYTFGDRGRTRGPATMGCMSSPLAIWPLPRQRTRRLPAASSGAAGTRISHGRIGATASRQS